MRVYDFIQSLFRRHGKEFSSIIKEIPHSLPVMSFDIICHRLERKPFL